MIPVYSAGIEDIDHVLFTCDFSKLVWKEVLRRKGVSRSPSGWGMECVYARSEGKGESFRAKIRCLSLAAAVYFLWSERNSHIVKQEGHDWVYVVHQIEENVRLATWYWRGRRNFQNWITCGEWGLYDFNVLVTFFV